MPIYNYIGSVARSPTGKTKKTRLSSCVSKLAFRVPETGIETPSLDLHRTDLWRISTKMAKSDHLEHVLPRQ